MRLKHICIFVSFFFCFLSVALQNASSQSPLPYYERDHRVEISYSVKKQSLTQDYELIITNNGDLILLQNNDYSKQPKVLNGKLSSAELEGLKDFIVRANIFNFDNEYLIDEDFIKLGSERLKITIDGRTKDILICSSTVPPELEAIINAIKKYKAHLLSNAAEK